MGQQGNRLTRTNVLSATHNQAYTYDGLHRLKTLDESTAANDRYWELDQLGNWDILRNGLTDTSTILENRTHNEANELTAFTTPAATIDPVHDLAGNMIEGPSPADPTVKHKYVYDAWNRLVKVTDANDVTIQENEYDGLNHRIQKVAGTDTYDYYYNQQWQVLEIRKNGDADPWKQYIYHPQYVDSIAIRFYDEDTDGAAVAHYYLQDANFNVTAVTDNTGTVAERYAYSPYGEVTIMNGSFAVLLSQVSTISNELLYTGRRLDSEAGLQLNRNRFYASHLGRWVNRDPIANLNYIQNATFDIGNNIRIDVIDGYPDGFNLYQYVHGNPVVLTDPSGLAWYWPDWFKPKPKPKPQPKVPVPFPQPGPTPPNPQLPAPTKPGGTKGAKKWADLCRKFNCSKNGKKLACDGLWRFCMRLPCHQTDDCLIFYKLVCPGHFGGK